MLEHLKPPKNLDNGLMLFVGMSLRMLSLPFNVFESYLSANVCGTPIRVSPHALRPQEEGDVEGESNGAVSHTGLGNLPKFSRVIDPNRRCLESI